MSDTKYVVTVEKLAWYTTDGGEPIIPDDDAKWELVGTAIHDDNIYFTWKQDYLNGSGDQFSVEAGRGICLNGKRILSIGRVENELEPADADSLTRLIARLLNKHTNG